MRYALIPFLIEKLPLILSVGRSELDDLRHANPNEIISVGGGQTRSDLRKKVYYSDLRKKVYYSDLRKKVYYKVEMV